ncbi:DUF3950 domain-containing protein [Alteromonas sp. RKMC-009]|uniref:DUF3950 domain-containing protein n=1 Tax=Alteromonas sp. RKMC-009 TaxID=2267264 RepID=UPI000E683712|nr:DUF3950 domain-containing protein [Alteromonas sp. RKMC-009]AYA64782.1 DUF3950 domain-containing protein [Alteromonas sp. RKMC-009]
MQEKKTKNKWGDDRPGSTKKFIRFPDDMIEQIDHARNCTDSGKPDSFSEWVKDACRMKLGQSN